MTLTERTRGSSSDSPTGSGRARGSPQVLRQGLWPHCSMFYNRVRAAYYAAFIEC